MGWPNCEIGRGADVSTSGSNDEWTMRTALGISPERWIFAGKFSGGASVSQEITIFRMAIGQLRARDFDRLRAWSDAFVVKMPRKMRKWSVRVRC